MFLIKSLDDLLKESGVTLEGTLPRVAQLEADEPGVSTTWLDVAGDGGGEGGGGCRAQWWEQQYVYVDCVGCAGIIVLNVVS